MSAIHIQDYKSANEYLRDLIKNDDVCMFGRHGGSDREILAMRCVIKEVQAELATLDATLMIEMIKTFKRV